MEREKRGKKRVGGNLERKTAAAVGAVLNTTIYGIVLWSLARDLGDVLGLASARGRLRP